MPNGDRERGPIEGDGSSPATTPVDPYLASLITAVLVGLAGLAIKLIGWMISH